jgi:drug/metabolite transporter (DMT)-like permease
VPHSRSGALPLFVAILSATAFGTSGTLVKPLLEAGWSPIAAVIVRVVAGGVLLLVPSLVALRGRLRPLWHSRWRVLGYAAFAVAGTQLAYFAAVQRIPVGMALLIEYLAPLILVGVVWIRTGRRPRPLVLAGSAFAVVGLVLVIGVVGGDAIAGSVDPIGVLYAALAALGLASYFLLGAMPDEGVPPIAFAGSTLLVGGALLGVVALTGLVPFRIGAAHASVAGAELPAWLLIAAIAVIPTAFAYVTGVTAAARLGSRTASFVGLAEVLFAAAFAWLLLGEALTPLQLLGGLAIVGGIACVRLAGADTPQTADQASIGEAPPAAVEDALDRRP